MSNAEIKLQPTQLWAMMKKSINIENRREIKAKDLTHWSDKPNQDSLQEYTLRNS